MGVASAAAEHLDEQSVSRPVVRTSEGLWLPALVLVANVAVALYLSYKIQYVENDALSRVANAYYVLFSRDPHLGAIGLIWNPLPSLMELPLVLLKPVFPALATRALAGSLLTAIFGALGVRQLLAILQGLGVDRRYRILAAIVYALNPLILLYSSNGMSDIILMTCYLGAIRGVLAYMDGWSLRPLMEAALWLVVAFGARYEAIPFTAVLVLGVVYAVSRARSRREAEGVAILLAAPVAYAASVWMYFNWLIMKNPLYFLVSPYGNISQVATGAYATPALSWAYHNVLNTLLYTMHFSLLYWPVWVGVAAALYWTFKRRDQDPRGIVLLAALLGALSLEMAMTYHGSLAAWDRFYIDYIAIGVVLVGFAASKALPLFQGRRALVLAGMVTLMALGDVGTWQAMQVPFLSNPDGVVVDTALAGAPLPSTNTYHFHVSSVAVYLNAHPHVLVLADSFDSYNAILQVHNPRQLVITSDEDFAGMLHNPLGRVNAILVPKPQNVGTLNAINYTYPRMWRGGVRWTYLITSFHDLGNMRLYGIKATAP